MAVRKETKVGQVDLPLEALDGDMPDDKLGVRDYYRGLANFIMRCETPMTIAIQGDWGSGKTSAMNYIKEDLRNSKSENVAVIEFNAWQYSQFDLGDALTFSLMHEIAAPMAAKTRKAEEFLRTVGKFGRWVAATGVSQAGAALGLSAASGRIVDALDSIGTEDNETNAVARLKNLRAKFDETVQDYCAQAGCSQVAIFIDDLDRINAQRAIEVLESLKLFLDVRRCVFVLAIDFEVVRQGVEAKYSMAGGSALSKDHARAYFDKIIQVPFRMPVASYRIESMIEKAVGVSRGDEMKEYVALARDSVGSNPRSIKRLMNTHSLLQIIHEARPDHSDQAALIRSKQVFALLCAQSAFYEFYDELIRVYQREDNDALDAFFEAVSDATSEQSGLRMMSVEDRIRLARFSQRFKNILEGFEGEAAADILGAALQVTNITRTGGSEVADETQDGSELIDSEAVLAFARRNTSVEASEAFELIRRELQQHAAAQGKPFSAVALTESVTHAINFYVQDGEEVLATSARGRRRFASVRCSKRKGISIDFGRSTPSDCDPGKSYSREWNGFVELLTSAESSQDNKLPNLRVSGNAYPLSFVEIKSVEVAQGIVNPLKKAFDIYVEQTGV